MSTDDSEEKDVQQRPAQRQVYEELLKEKEFITKRMDGLHATLSKLDTDAKETQTSIHALFDSLQKTVEQRKQRLLHDLETRVLASKSEALQQMEGMAKYQQKLNDMEQTYLAFMQDDEKVDGGEQAILAMPKQFEHSTYASIQYEARRIELSFDLKESEAQLQRFAHLSITRSDEAVYDTTRVPPFVDGDGDRLLTTVPVHKLYRWTLKTASSAARDTDEHVWKSIMDNSEHEKCAIHFYQNLQSYKIRMVAKTDSDSATFCMNQWVSPTLLAEKESLVWLWTALDAVDDGDGDSATATRWCCRFHNHDIFSDFATQYDKARKLNREMRERERQVGQQALQEMQVRQKNEEIDARRLSSDRHKRRDAEDEASFFNEHGERQCNELNVARTYLWHKNVNGDKSQTGEWKVYAHEAVLQFWENRDAKKIRILLTESESQTLKLNHWIPVKDALTSAGPQMWQWQVYDELGSNFLQSGCSRSSLKIVTVCAAFVDKQDTEKFKTLFDKYQKINQIAAEAPKLKDEEE